MTTTGLKPALLRLRVSCSTVVHIVLTTVHIYPSVCVILPPITIFGYKRDQHYNISSKRGVLSIFWWCDYPSYMNILHLIDST